MPRSLSLLVRATRSRGVIKREKKRKERKRGKNSLADRPIAQLKDEAGGVDASSPAARPIDSRDIALDDVGRSATRFRNFVLIDLDRRRNRCQTGSKKADRSERRACQFKQLLTRSKVNVFYSLFYSSFSLQRIIILHLYRVLAS